VIREALAALSEIVVGKDNEIRLCLACLVAKGHLLIEDQPGVGKTTLAHALAQVLGLSYQRIQFTSDLLPADVIGVSVFDRDTAGFRFHRGPIFSQVILADEVNRANPKAQSALLEAMEEGQVTADGNTYSLPRPFFVIATQKPSYQVGTFPLPESQLDRFLMRIHLGYPAPTVERELLTGRDRRALLKEISPVLDPDALAALQERVTDIHVAPALLDYVQALIAYSREAPAFESGLSPRAAINLVRAAQAWALLDERNNVVPEDVQAVLSAVAAHRLRLISDERMSQGTNIGEYLRQAVPVP
jgi:MoxR-like ATPase